MELIDEEMNLQLINAELAAKRMALRRDDTFSHTHQRDSTHVYHHRASSVEHVYTKQVFIYEEEVDDENL